MQLLEHIHVNVDSLAVTRDFLEAAVPTIVRRGGGNAPGYGPWLHVGDDSSYIALTEVPGSTTAPNLRHIGIVVNDIAGLIARLQAAGYSPADASELDSHPHRRRIYYADGNGLDWEFVEYLTANVHERNDYSL
jgi:hypothetical protein